MGNGERRGEEVTSGGPPRGGVARDPTIDALRTLALCAIVLAHSGASGWLFNVRSFDVTCLAMLSAMSFSLSRAKSRSGRLKGGVWGYLLARIRRLLVPTYVFLFVFFALLGLLRLCGWTGTSEISVWSFGRVLDAFLLGKGITWIVRVYVLLALLNPAIAALSGRVRKHVFYLGIVALCVPLQLLALRFAPPAGTVSLGSWFYRGVVLFALGYGSVGLLGYRHRVLSRRCRMLVAGTIATGLFLFWWANGFLPLQQFKYPPHPYYLAYGVVVTLVLYELFSLDAFLPVATNRFVGWVSRNSLWIFFWHYIGVLLLDVIPFPPPFGRFVALRWGFNMGMGLFLTAIQNALRTAWCNGFVHR